MQFLTEFPNHFAPWHQAASRPAWGFTNQTDFAADFTWIYHVQLLLVFGSQTVQPSQHHPSFTTQSAFSQESSIPHLWRVSRTENPKDFGLSGDSAAVLSLLKGSRRSGSRVQPLDLRVSKEKLHSLPSLFLGPTPPPMIGKDLAQHPDPTRKDLEQSEVQLAQTIHNINTVHFPKSIHPKKK